MITFKIYKLILFIVFIFISSVKTYSQQWLNYSVADGLSNNQITAIIEDDQDKIWVGTIEGLNRFNGRDWTNYSRAKGDPLIDDFITAIIKDREGKLWIGTGKGLVIIDPGSDLKNPVNWHSYDHFNTQGGLLDTVITAILEDDSGNVWIETEGKGICIVSPHLSGEEDPLLNPHNWRTVYPDTQWYNLNILAIEKDQQGNIWVGMPGGVSRYNPGEHEINGKWDFIFKLGYVCSIYADRYGYVWFGRAEQCLARVLASDPQNIDSFSVVVNVAAIEEDADGRLWFGTSNPEDGIYVVDPNSDLNDADNWFEYTQDNGLAGHLINCIFLDGEGDMWIGTDGRGISKYDMSWINYSGNKIELDFTSVVAIIEDDRNNLWLGTEDRGIRMANLKDNLLVYKNWKILREQDKALASDYISSIYKDDTGFIWIGTIPDGTGREGLNLVNPESDLINPGNWLTITVENTDSGLIDNRVNAIAQDNERYMWFGTGKGLCRAHRTAFADELKLNDPATWTKFDTSNGLLSNIINSIFIDKINNIWVGTFNGINLKKFYDSLQHSWRWVEMLEGKEINTIYQDREDNLWFGTKRDGVFKLDYSDTDSFSNWTVFTSKHGLASNNVRSIAQKQPHEYWFGTGSGLTRLRVFESDSVWTIFKPADGPASISIWAAYEDSKGDLWFGEGWKGITRHRKKISAPETYICSKLDVVTTENILIAFKGSDLNTSPEKLKYSYQLDNTGWSFFQPTEMKQIFNLDNGRHLFEVRAMDMDGNIDPTPARDVFYKIDPNFGGKVEFCDSIACVRLYFPPGILQSGGDGAKIHHVKEYELTDPSEVVIAYNIEFNGFAPQIDRPSTLAISLMNSENLSPPRSAIFQFKKDSGWIGIGGTMNSKDDSLIITTAITESGIYAIRTVEINEILDTEISVQPRVFSPSGHGKGFGNCINISFPLKKNSKATVKIYNIAGRLKRVIIDNEPLLPGNNVVEWDGRDDEGNFCRSGLYIIAIEAEGKVHTKTVVVSNRYR